MRKASIKHVHLRRVMEDFEENVTEESVEKLVAELKHSCLILAANIVNGTISFVTTSMDDGDYGLLFTDMDEFRKVFPANEVEAHEHVFEFYADLVKNSGLKGFIINIKSECFVLWDELLDEFGEMPDAIYRTEGAYTSKELKEVKDSIDNAELERFVENPSNTGKYEELIDKLSSSTLLTLMLSDLNLKDLAEDGVISLEKTGPVAYLYTDDVNGCFATVYTSASKMDAVKTDLFRYSQLVNLSQMTNFILNDDMDGIIINPETDNVILGRDMLLEYSPILEKVCNDSKLNSAVLHMFLME